MAQWRRGGQWRSNPQSKELAIAIEKCVLGNHRKYARRSAALMWTVRLSHQLTPDYVQYAECIFSRVRRLAEPYDRVRRVRRQHPSQDVAGAWVHDQLRVPHPGPRHHMLWHLDALKKFVGDGIGQRLIGHALFSAPSLVCWTSRGFRELLFSST